MDVCREHAAFANVDSPTLQELHHVQRVQLCFPLHSLYIRGPLQLRGGRVHQGRWVSTLERFEYCHNTLVRQWTS